jgi:site-specific recombinase XerD
LRRADLVTLTWAQVEEFSIVKKALKSSRRRRRIASIPRIPELDALLDVLRTRHREERVQTILVNSYGRPWTADGFGGSFNRIRDATDITHVDDETGIKKKKHLHDVRGTFATKLIAQPAGLSDQEVADMMAWSPQQVADIRRVYVDQARVVVAIGERISRAL